METENKDLRELLAAVGIGINGAKNAEIGTNLVQLKERRGIVSATTNRITMWSVGWFGVLDENSPIDEDPTFQASLNHSSVSDTLKGWGLGKVELLENKLKKGVAVKAKQGSNWANFAKGGSFDTPGGVRDLPETEDPVHIFKVKTSDFKRAIDRVVWAVGSDQARPVLTGIRLVVTGGRLTLCAVDGFQLAICEIDLIDNQFGESLSTILPGVELKKIADLFNKKNKGGDQELTIEIEGNSATFEADYQFGDQAGRLVVGLLKIEGNYPEVEQLIPKELKVVVEANSRELKSAFGRAGIINSESYLTKFMVDNKSIGINTELSEVGAHSEIVEAVIESNGDSFASAVNSLFMLHALEAAGSDRIKIGFQTPYAPIKITAVDDPYWLSIVMPMMQS